MEGAFLQLLLRFRALVLPDALVPAGVEALEDAQRRAARVPLRHLVLAVAGAAVYLRGEGQLLLLLLPRQVALRGQLPPLVLRLVEEAVVDLLRGSVAPRQAGALSSGLACLEREREKN
jgi:hypothetical protein